MSTQMEQPFYHDDSFLSAYGPSDAAMHDSYKLLKQNMNLNLNLTEPSYRSLKSQLYQAHAHAHAHQDAHGSLKLASPELERLIIQNGNGGVITTPTPAPGQYFYNRGITDEQEGFAEGFVKALDELHKINQVQMPPPPPNVSLGSGGVSSASSSVFGSSLQQPEPPIYTTLNAYCPNAASLSSSSSSSSYPTATISYLPPSHHHHHQQSHLLPQSGTGGAHLFQHPGGSSALLPPHPNRLALLKEEPQTVPDLLSDDGSGFGSPPPPMSPIDMADQERIKTERKRLRNRLAATKCRKRKLERISRLEDKVKALKSDNAGLSGSALLLRDQVARLKHKVLTHVGSGCQLMLTSKMEAF